MLKAQGALGAILTACLLGTLGALAGCAQAPRAPEPLPPKITVTVSPPVAPESSSSADTSTDLAAQNPETAPPASPEPITGIDPSAYADLFDRMRAGFALPEVDRPAVTQQLTWFVENPDFVQRSFESSELYLYHIVTQLEARHMPLELALLPVIESAYQPYARSRTRALGLWQFMAGTATRFGLKQNWWYDGRRDVIESTRAALDYLQSLHQEFNGDWLLAIAAYNCGEMTVARAIQVNQAAGRPTDFWDLRLPRETRAYVPKLLAMTRLVKSPEVYGLSLSGIPNRPYFARVETGGQIDLRVAAEIAGVSLEAIYELNPAFHRWATDPAGPDYLLLPTEAAPVFQGNLAQLTPDERMRVRHYAVRHGDTLYRIARHFGTRPEVIRELNELPNGAVVVGTDLRVPSDVRELPPQVLRAAALVDARERRILRPRVRVLVHRGDSFWAIARRHGMNPRTLAMINGMQLSDPLRAGQRLRLTSGPARAPSLEADDPPPKPSHHRHHARRVTYVVRAGDTLYRISRLFEVTVSQIVRWNGLSHVAILPGQRLLIRLASR
ncbi:MAG: LysM peptidoglycan-binding domain-containing protein [Steroidobacteraceae bacterium]